jgi:hypothetical protein
MLTTELVHLPMHTIDQFRILFLFCRRRSGSRLAEVPPFGCRNALVLLREGPSVLNSDDEAGAYGKIQSYAYRSHRLGWFSDDKLRSHPGGNQVHRRQTLHSPAVMGTPETRTSVMAFYG